MDKDAMLAPRMAGTWLLPLPVRPAGDTVRTGLAEGCYSLNIFEIAISHSPRSQLNLFAECKNFVFQHRWDGSCIMSMSLIQNYIDGWRILTFHEPKQLSEVHLESDIKGQC